MKSCVYTIRSFCHREQPTPPKQPRLRRPDREHRDEVSGIGGEKESGVQLLTTLTKPFSVRSACPEQRRRVSSVASVQLLKVGDLCALCGKNRRTVAVRPEGSVLCALCVLCGKRAVTESR